MPDDYHQYSCQSMYSQLGGLKVGDYIVEIGGHDAKYYTQAQVLEKIRTSNNTLDLKIITPMLYSSSKPVFTIIMQFITLVRWLTFFCYCSLM
jgi:C-terminal processing protease CtpA/Prc